MVAKHLSLLALALLQRADALLVGAAGVHLRRASIHSMYMKDSSDALNSGEACHLLSDTQRGAIHDMVASDGDDMGSPRNQVIDSLYVECDQPSEDPNMTCFLAPESWVHDPSGKGEVLHSNTYLCMETPSPSRQPGVMNGEDSY